MACRKTLFSLSLFFVLSACSSIDKGLMTVSETVSSHDPVTGERQLSLISEQKEVETASERTLQILADAKQEGRKIDQETPHFARVKEIFDRLLKVSHREHLPWEVHVIENEAFNAYTIGGGKVFVFTGLIEDSLGVRTDDELAAVLAHEIAHVTARHASEKGTKLAAAKLADSDLNNQVFEASFTTNQEKEADKYAAIYMALAGFNPEAASEIWKRHDKARGSNVGTLAHTHPIYDERAQAVTEHAYIASAYYTPDEINPQANELKLCNELYCYEQPSEHKAGEGGGLLAFVDTLGNAFVEAMEAKKEQRKRTIRKMEEQNLARSSLQLNNLQIKTSDDGRKWLVGELINRTTKDITSGSITLVYWQHKNVIHQKQLPLRDFEAYEQHEFALPLEAINFTNVGLVPQYVNFAD